MFLFSLIFSRILHFPKLLMYERNDRDFKNLPLVWEPRMVLGCKSMFDFSQLKRLKNDEVFTSYP